MYTPWTTAMSQIPVGWRGRAKSASSGIQKLRIYVCTELPTRIGDLSLAMTRAQQNPLPAIPERAPPPHPVPRMQSAQMMHDHQRWPGMSHSDPWEIDKTSSDESDGAADFIFENKIELPDAALKSLYRVGFDPATIRNSQSGST